jgi:hypothetical protein
LLHLKEFATSIQDDTKFVASEDAQMLPKPIKKFVAIATLKNNNINIIAKVAKERKPRVELTLLILRNFLFKLVRF